MKKTCPFCKQGSKAYQESGRSHNDASTWECDSCHMKGDDRDDYDVVKTERMTNRTPKSPSRSKGYIGSSYGRKSQTADCHIPAFPPLRSGSKSSISFGPAGFDRVAKSFMPPLAAYKSTPCKSDFLTEATRIYKDTECTIVYQFTATPLINEEASIIGGVFIGNVKVYDIVIDTEQSKFTLRNHGLQSETVAKVLKATLRPAAKVLEIVWDKDPSSVIICLTYRVADEPQTDKKHAEGEKATDVLHVWRYKDKVIAIKPHVLRKNNAASVHTALIEAFGDDLDLHDVSYVGETTLSALTQIQGPHYHQ